MDISSTERYATHQFIEQLLFDWCAGFVDQNDVDDAMAWLWELRKIQSYTPMKAMYKREVVQAAIVYTDVFGVQVYAYNDAPAGVGYGFAMIEDVADLYDDFIESQDEDDEDDDFFGAWINGLDPWDMPPYQTRRALPNQGFGVFYLEDENPYEVRDMDTVQFSVDEIAEIVTWAERVFGDTISSDPEDVLAYIQAKLNDLNMEQPVAPH